MFGYVMANSQELRPEQRKRYLGCYCGICRAIGARASLASRVALNYDMVFLALLLSSLYEPAEEQGSGRCLVHPLASRPWRQNEATFVCADMNVALAYFSADDHWRDDHRPDALALRRLLRPHYEAIQSRFPRQCRAIETCIQDLSRLESERCPNPDLPANCFGLLMAELFCWRDDRWSGYLRQMAMGLGRFIYFVDAAVDYRKDLHRGSYNPFLAMGGDPDPEKWEDYLVLEMGRATRAYEMLPLVQDKDLLDNILYSGVWVTYRRKEKKSAGNRAGGSNMIDDPYQVLGLGGAHLTKRSKSLPPPGKKYHPDANPGDAEAARKMQEINAAYEQIKNPPQTGPSGYGGGSYTGGAGYGQDPFEDIFWPVAAKQRQQEPQFHTTEAQAPTATFNMAASRRPSTPWPGPKPGTASGTTSAPWPTTAPATGSPLWSTSAAPSPWNQTTPCISRSSPPWSRGGHLSPPGQRLPRLRRPGGPVHASVPVLGRPVVLLPQVLRVKFVLNYHPKISGRKSETALISCQIFPYDVRIQATSPPGRASGRRGQTSSLLAWLPCAKKFCGL